MTLPHDPPPTPVKRKRPATPTGELCLSIRRSRAVDCSYSVFSSMLPGTTFVNAGPHDGGDLMPAVQPPAVPQVVSVDGWINFPSKLDELTPLGVVPQCTPGPASSPGLKLSTGTTSGLAKLAQETHARAAAQLQSKQDSSQTGRSYSRHVRNYEKYWHKQQQGPEPVLDSDGRSVAAFPITATKAAAFLHYEMSRPKLKPNREVEPGAIVGKYHIQQAISALEDWRTKNVHQYPNEPEMQHPFRTDWRISQLESVAKNLEPQRVVKAQALKAVGGSADTYTTEEVLRCSLSLIMDRGTGPQHILVSLRDRAMFLIAAQSAFRGESSRILLWSDCYRPLVPINDISVGYTVPVLGMMASNAKHNQHGRLDEHGVMRHANVKVCAVGALAFLFWAMFHVVDFAPTESELTPDFAAGDCGPFGIRKWYRFHIFFGTNREAKMSYENHRDRIRTMHKANGIDISKVTHATRPYAALTARANGATETGTKALGCWNDGSAYRNCYERALPLDAMLGAAGFNGKKPGDFALPRGELDVPAELLRMLFPWIEEQRAKLDARFALDARAQDYALRNFLELLTWLRLVLLQDAVILFNEHPECGIWNFAPFNTPGFRRFAAQAAAVLQAAEAEAAAAVRNLPEACARTMQGIATHSLVQQRQQFDTMHANMRGMADTMHNLETAVTDMARGRTGRRRKVKATAPPDPIPTESKLPAGEVSLFEWPVGVPTGTPMEPLVDMPIESFDSFGNLPSLYPPSFTQQPLTTPLSLFEPLASPPSCALDLPLAISLPTRALIQVALDDRSQKELTLIAELGKSRFDMHHPWEWNTTTGELIPTYQYQTASTIKLVWTEWADGLNGRLPVRFLMERWGTAWRRGCGRLKVEYLRRQKIIAIIDELIKRPRWDVKLALKFLSESYSHMTARQFSDSITLKNKGERLKAINAAADSYC